MWQTVANGHYKCLNSCSRQHWFCSPFFMIGSRWLLQLGTCLSKAQLRLYQTKMTSLLVPPSSVRGQTKLDCEAFKHKVDSVPSLLLPHKILNEYKDKIKKVLLKLPNFKTIQPYEVKEERKCLVYLDPEKMKDLSGDFKQTIQWDQNYQEKELQLCYENWPCHDILRAILPEDIDVPTSYSVVGHMLHMNLREEQLPYKTVIGQVYLDKIKNIKTVVNKLDQIDSTYRNFAMEILAGEENTIVFVKEHGITFHFDFAKVYWNPRLATEHVTLVERLKKNDVLYDVFAGVGPFAVPAAVKGVKVLANDLNPESYKWLMKNVEVNKVKNLVTAFNKDGRDFIRCDVKKDILDRREKNLSGTEHFAMNLPAIAVEFLDVFKDWLSADEIEKVLTNPPIVHVYCFIKVAKTDDYCACAKQLVEEQLRLKLDADAIVEIHHVRNVAPNKEMMRVSLTLTQEILRGSEKNEQEEEEEPAKKIMKLSNDNANPNFPDNENGQEQEQAEKQRI